VPFKADGEAILLVGAPEGWGTHLGQSTYLREILGREEGPPPPVDLGHERKVGDFVRGLIRAGSVTAVHDCSDGGLAVALAEMAMASGIGAAVDALPDAPLPALFGEDQGRYVVTVAADGVDAVLAGAKAAGVAAVRIGVTGGADLKLGDAISISVAMLREAHENWFPAFMSGEL
jgi:phosphoribosylformylglycinamidine synthase